MNAGELQIEALLGRLDEIIEQLQSEKDRLSGLRVAEKFMSVVYRLGLQLHQQPELRESTQLKEFLERNWINGGFFHHYYLADFLRDLDDVLTSESWDDELSGACCRRSQFEFFLDLYPELLENPVVAEEVADVDEHLRYKLKHDVPLEKNTEVPNSHWWWH